MSWGRVSEPSQGTQVPCILGLSVGGSYRDGRRGGAQKPCVQGREVWEGPLAGKEVEEAALPIGRITDLNSNFCSSSTSCVSPGQLFNPSVSYDHKI